MIECRVDDVICDVVDWFKCEFMLDYVGDIFEGVVSLVMNFGLFVCFIEYYIDGLVYIILLDDDFYYYDEVK